MISGLMRFYYLTLTRPPGEAEPPETEVVTEPTLPDLEPVPLYPTQLTARKGGRSRKKQ